MENYLNQVLGDRYEIQEIIGVGGMAVVYKAYDRVDDRIVAVKILKDEYLANEEFRRRFKNESKAIAVLSHPNIVKVYDVSFGEKLQYIVMEHVEGITLKEYIERQKVVDWKEAVHFVIQILRALQHAHDKGIIHRDIKPQNILLLPNATIKVTDFGIARFNRGEMRSVAENGAIGSVHYVSPEQARGEYTDEKSDIYSVGVVLYEMLTGKLPFDSESDESVALMQMQTDAEKPSAINSSIPIGLEQITLRAMQKNPADRYQSAAEFLLDLDEFKRNPLIKFDYSYFIDKTPTKYIKTAEAPIPTSPVRIVDEDEYEAEPQDEEEIDGEYEDEDDEEEEQQKNTTLPILIGIAISLVLVVGIIILIAFADPIRTYFKGSDNTNTESGVTEDADDGGFFSKLDIFGWFSKDKIEIPNFINMKYEDVIAQYPDLAFENPPAYEYNSIYEDGHICDQQPVAGKKVSKDTVIKLTVASSGEMVLINDVAGKTATEAEATLKALGLNVELVPTISSTVPEGQVLYTDPSANTYIANQGIVYIYYASASDNINSARVPSVVGDQLSIAEAKIKSAGLKVGAITYDSSSASLKDYVIGQNPASFSAVNSGVYVNLVVGNGIPASTTADFSITLPSMPTGTTNTIKTYLNNNAYDIIPDVALNGSSYKLSFTGSGSDNTFKIYIDTILIYAGSIDFSTDPPTFSNVVTYTYSIKETVPSVIGQTKEAAIVLLAASGFNKIKIKTDYSSTVPEGCVITQSPLYSSLTKYSTATTITIVVSLGSNGAEVPTEPPIVDIPTSRVDIDTTVPEPTVPVSGEPTDVSTEHQPSAE